MKLLAHVISTKLQIYPFFFTQKGVCVWNQQNPASLWFMTHFWPTLIEFPDPFLIACVWMTIDKPTLCHPNLSLHSVRLHLGHWFIAAIPPRDQFVQSEQDLLLLNRVNNSMWTWERNYHWLSPISQHRHIGKSLHLNILDCLFVSASLF